MGKRIGIVGTRFTPLHSRKWEQRIERFIDSLPPDTELIINGAAGTDRTAADRARERGLKVHVLFPGAIYSDDRRFFLHHNQTVVDQADEVYAFWDGNSAGTQHAISLARYLKKPVHVELVHDEEWQQVR